MKKQTVGQGQYKINSIGYEGDVQLIKQRVKEHFDNFVLKKEGVIQKDLDKEMAYLKKSIYYLFSYENYEHHPIVQFINKAKQEGYIIKDIHQNKTFVKVLFQTISFEFNVNKIYVDIEGRMARLKDFEKTKQEYMKKYGYKTKVTEVDRTMQMNVTIYKVD